MNSRVQAQAEEIDITPLLDVVFILLIFFVVTASFVKQEGIGLYKPEISDLRSPIVQSVEIKILQDSRVVLVNREINLSILRSHIDRLLAQDSETKFQIRIAPKASLERLVSVLDELRVAKVYNPPLQLIES